MIFSHTVTLSPTDVQSCPGDGVTFSCVTDNGGLERDMDNILYQQIQNSRHWGIFHLQLVMSINGSTYTSSAAATGSILVYTTISCFDVKDNVMSSVINVLGLLLSVW